MQRARIVVHGHVQGVFFRSNARRIASKLNLKGYARNMADGTVEVVAEGPEEKIKDLIDFCRRGPDAAEVIKVDVKFEKPGSEFDGFEVLY